MRSFVQDLDVGGACVLRGFLRDDVTGVIIAEIIKRSRLPFISFRATNNPGAKSQDTISPGLASLASAGDSR